MTSSSHEGKMYSVEAGDYGGSYIVVVESTDKLNKCLQLPEVKQLDVPVASFKHGIDNKYVNFVAELHDDVYYYCKQVYEKTSNIRR